MFRKKEWEEAIPIRELREQGSKCEVGYDYVSIKFKWHIVYYHTHVVKCKVSLSATETGVAAAVVELARVEKSFVKFARKEADGRKEKGAGGEMLIKGHIVITQRN